MKTVKLTAEEIRWLEYQMWANACAAACVVNEETGHRPRNMDCDNCRFTRAMRSIERKVFDD